METNWRQIGLRYYKQDGDMYLVIGKGQIAQKTHCGENKLKSQIKGKYKYLFVF